MEVDERLKECEFGLRRLAAKASRKKAELYLRLQVDVEVRGRLIMLDENPD